MYDNIHTKLFTLPDDTLVLPGHDYKGRCMSSIGEEKRHNPRLTKSREEFIEVMKSLNLPHPKQIARSLPANMKVGWLALTHSSQHTRWPYHLVCNNRG